MRAHLSDAACGKHVLAAALSKILRWTRRLLDLSTSPTARATHMQMNTSINALHGMLGEATPSHEDFLCLSGVAASAERVSTSGQVLRFGQLRNATPLGLIRFAPSSPATPLRPAPRPGFCGRCTAPWRGLQAKVQDSSSAV